jgi:putative transposase
MNKRRRRSDAQWQQLIEQQERSGLNAGAFCRQQGLSSKTFYKRRQVLHQQKTTTASTERFIKIQPTATPATAVVLYYQRAQLHLPASVDAFWLAQLMQALS